MNDSTKAKILEVSHKLFADKGFNGTSVREIAKESDVNIAAINYHFQNKENLYLQTMAQSIIETDNEVKVLYEKHKDDTIEDFSGAIFEHFISNSEDLRTGFKLITSNDILKEKAGEVIGHQLEDYKGPPGGKYIGMHISSNYPNATEADIQWAVRVIFSLIVHKALVMCNDSICTSMAEMGITQDSTKEDIKRVVSLLIKEIA